MNRMFVFAVATSCLLCGCDNHQEKVPQVENGSVSKVVADRDTIAVRIDGKDILQKEIIRNGKVILMLNMNSARKTKIKKREIKAVEKYCRSAVKREIGRAAVAKYIEERGLTVPSNVVKSVTSRFERQYGALSVKLRRRHNVQDLKCMLKKNAPRVDEMIDEMAKFQVMTNDLLCATNLVVSEEAVSARLKEIRKTNLRIAETNAMVFAKASNVWSRIVGNELTFEQAAAQFSEDEYIREGCDWGCFTRDQLDEERELLKFLPTIKDGDITPPIESDGGLAILRKDPDDNDKSYSFSRVFFRLPYFYEEETADQARASLLESLRQNYIQNTIKDYIGKLKIEYPDGTNIVWKLTARDFK